MYRVMIVDDEPTIRKGLLNFIPWDTLECEVVCLAYDGIDALEKLNVYKPDIVLTDIKMPAMDGIELARHIISQFPSVKTIMLTAYSEFEYAQSAVKYGVVDFVLKPTSTEKLAEAIKKAKAMIKQERENSMKMELLKQKLSENRNEMQEAFLFKIINRALANNEKIKEKALSLGIQLNNYFAAVIMFDNENNANSSLDKGEISALTNLVSMILREYTHYTIILNDKILCTFLNFDNGGCSENMLTVADICNEVIHTVKSLVRADILVGISNVKNDICQASDAFEEGLKALSNKFYIDRDIFVFTEYNNLGGHLEPASINKYFDLIIKYMKSGEYERSISTLDEMFEIQRNLNVPAMAVKEISILLYSRIINIIPDMNLDLNCPIMSSLDILKSESFENIRGKLAVTIELVSKSITASKTSNLSIISKVNEYIETHYSEDIDLASIARYVHLNSSYLSRLYKKETNKTITEKITQMRIERAKELLTNTEYKIYEISSMVGLENTNYFSTLFKRYTSYYPKDYRVFHTDSKQSQHKC